MRGTFVIIMNPARKNRLGRYEAPPRFQPQTIIVQLADFLRQRIRASGWTERLPGERDLCELLRVSRATLRPALQILCRRGIIRVKASGGYYINQRIPVRRRTAARRIVILFGLSPDYPLVGYRDDISIRLLDQYLRSAGYETRMLTFSGHWKTDSAKRLEVLVKRERACCWILDSLSWEAYQWFMQRQVPCLDLGCGYAGIDLPTSGYDYRAGCRHAVQTLIRLGHRSIGLVMPFGKYGGEILSEQGFRQGFPSPLPAGFHPNVIRHDGTKRHLAELLRAYLRSTPAPSALIVCLPWFALAAVTQLLRQGVRIPQTMSVICREDWEPLAWFIPAITRYTYNEQQLAHKRARFVITLAQGRVPVQRHIRIIPQLIPGETIGPPPSVA